MFKRTYNPTAFFESGTYLLTILSVVIISWSFGLSLVGLYFFGLTIIYICLTQKSLMGVLPLLATGTFLFNDIVAVQTPLFLGSIIGILSLCFVAIGFFMIKNKVKPRFTSPMIGFIAMFIASIFGGITNNHFGTSQWLIGFGSTAAIMVGFFLLSSAIKEVNRDYFAKIFVITVLILVAETWIYYAQQEDVVQSMMHKAINLGWGISNNIALILLSAMPFCLYLATKSSAPAPYLAIFAVASVTMIFTFSRGCIIILAVCIIPLAIITLLKSKEKKQSLLIVAIITVAIAIIIGAMLNSRLGIAIKEMLDKGLGDNGRITLWIASITDWLGGNLFIGRGFAYNSPLSGTLNYINWYHCAPLQMLSNLGIFGFLAFTVHIAQRYYFLTVRKGSFTFFAFAGSFMTSVYGMMDVTYFTPYFLLTMLLIFLMTYNDTKFPKADNPLATSIDRGI